MNRRLILAVFFIFSGGLLLMFSNMMSRGSVTFAVTVAKHGWDKNEKARTLQNAGLMCFGGGILSLVIEGIFGWFASTGPGQAISRCWKQSSFKAYRMVWNKEDDRGFKSSDTSDDENNEMASKRFGVPGMVRFASSPSSTPPPQHLGGHTRRRSGNQARGDQDTSMVPSAAPASSF